MLIYLCSPTLSQISLKNSFGKVFFQIMVKIEMTRNKNRLFIVFNCAYIHGANYNFCEYTVKSVLRDEILF